MKKLTVKGNPISLEYELIKIGQKLEFTAADANLQDYKLNNNLPKVISVFPSIDTSVCDLQSKKFADIAKQYDKKYEFISISLDLPQAQKRWCLANSANLNIISDYKYKSFAKASGFLIKELQLLARGLIVLNKNNEVQWLKVMDELTDSPNFEELKTILK